MSTERSLAFASWGWLAISGLVTVALGVVCVAFPDATLTVLAVVFSLALVGTGLIRLGLALVLLRWVAWRRLVQGVLGVLLVVAGIVGLVDPMSSLRLFTLLVGVAFVLAAAGDLAVAVSDRRGDALSGGGPPPGTWSRARRWSVLGSGIAHLVIGLVFLLTPQFGLVALAVAVGAALVLLGAVQLVAAYHVRKLVRRALAMVQQQGRPGPDDPKVIRGEVL